MKQINILNRLSVSRDSGLSRPCMDNLIFQGGVFVGGLYLDKDRVRANDAQLLSTCIYLNGIDAKISKTFTNDILYYLDKLTIVYSVDGVNTSTWVTGNAQILGLLNIDLENQTIEIGFDGTEYKAMWVSHIIFEYNNGTETITWAEFTLSLRDETKDYNITTNEEEWVDFLVPLFSTSIRDTLLIDKKL